MPLIDFRSLPRAIYIPTKSRSDSTTENHKISNGMPGLPGGMPRNSFEDKLQVKSIETQAPLPQVLRAQVQFSLKRQ